MNINKLMSTILLAFLVMVTFQASANDISLASAHAIANNYIKQHAAKAPGSLKAPATADIKLIHAEPSSKVSGSNVYYAFNIEGGGFIIIAGDDRASKVLGYSDKGKIDFNHLPTPLKGLLDHYKYDIEYVQTHHLTNAELGMRHSLKEGTVVLEPMTTSTWGQENPYYLQCPVYDDQYSKVGCAGVCMAQMVYFWKYPPSCSSYPSYYNNYAHQATPSLPATTFDYSKMLDAYCHWDWDISEPVQDIFNEEQVQEAAKLCRYVGQAARMQYSPSMSLTQGPHKLNGMLSLGYNPEAQIITCSDYDTETWEALMRDELDAGRPIMYAGFGRDNVSVGHAFIIDGYDTEGFFHINMGWYGTNDGWYVMSAITFINRYGEYRDYSNRTDMIQNMEPPTFCTIQMGDIDANSDLLVLGETFYPLAHDVYLFTSHRTLDLMFSLTDASGAIVATGEPLPVIRHRFEQGCEINLPLTLPTTLASGTYNLKFGYSTADEGNSLINVQTASGQLVVVGKLAKYNGNFDISDITQAINDLLNGSTVLDISDVTELIEYVLNQ